MSDMKVRLATEADLVAINEIYNYYVFHSTCTYETDPTPDRQRAEWYASHGPRYPITVGEMDGRVVAWGSLSRFHPRCAYRKTVEDSVYIRHDMHHRGLGTIILKDLIRRARDLEYHTILASIDAAQAASIALHAKLGFRPCAELKEVGFKFDRWLDVVYMQLML